MTFDRFSPSAGPDLPSGRYYGRVVDFERRSSERYGSDFLIWHCEVAYGSELVAVSGTSSTAFGHPSAKATAWVSAILDRAIGRESIERAAILGRPVIIHVGRNANDWPQVVDFEPWRGDRTGLAPFAPRGAQTVATAATVPERPSASAPAAWRPDRAAPAGQDAAFRSPPANGAPVAWPTPEPGRIVAPAEPSPEPGPARPPDDLPF
jgi:hypothetical protein